jgi:mevalonate kinase
MTTGSAPGKAILMGEHAVVYGRLALAIPVPQVQAMADLALLTDGESGEMLVEAPQIERLHWLSDMSDGDPLALAIRLGLRELGLDSFPGTRLVIRSTIPIAAGLGSGAAVSVAILRGLCAFFRGEISPARQSEIAFEVDKIHHGTPSGIDNTVIAFGEPIAFRKGQPPARLRLGAPITLIIADSGISSPTAHAVGQVREMWESDRTALEMEFDNIGMIVSAARQSLERGEIDPLGTLMDLNQSALESLGLSHPAVDRLVEAARGAGARGAKLSGAGLGGNVLALVDPEMVDDVAKAMLRAGAVTCLRTEVPA